MLLAHGYTYNFGVLPVPVLDRMPFLSPNARLCLVVLDGFGKAVIRPHLPTVARRMGLSEESTKSVIKALVELVQAGLLEVVAGRGAHSPNTYYLKLPLYCRIENPLVADRIRNIPFQVNLKRWSPALPAGVESIPMGYCQLSTGRVVPLDDVPRLDDQVLRAAAAAAGADQVAAAAAPGVEALAQLGTALEGALAGAVASLGGTAEALGLAEQLGALMAVACRQLAGALVPQPPLLTIARPAPPAAESVAFLASPLQDQAAAGALEAPPGPAAAGAVVSSPSFLKNFFGPGGSENANGLSQSEPSTKQPLPSSSGAQAPRSDDEVSPATTPPQLPAKARSLFEQINKAGHVEVDRLLLWLSDMANRVQLQRLGETQGLSNEREIDLGSLGLILKNLDAWKAWPSTWERLNPGLTWSWSAPNLVAAAQITAAAGEHELAAALSRFSKHTFWSSVAEPGRRVPLQALAKYIAEYLPAPAPALQEASSLAPRCSHGLKVIERNYTYSATEGHGMSYDTVCHDCGQEIASSFVGVDALRIMAKVSGRQEDLEDLAELEGAIAGAAEQEASRA